MRSDYQYDVFISFAHEDEEKVRPIYDKIRQFGLRPFWSKDLPQGKEFPSELEKALKDSQHFVLNCSEKAAKSNWVCREWQMFLDLYHLRDPENRRMYVLLDAGCVPNLIPDLLKHLQRPNSPDELLAALVGVLERDYDRTMVELELVKRKVTEAQEYYRYNRFWGPIVKNREVNIFTCGRVITHDPKGGRGYGGRTNIDLWDFRAVLNITDFFGSNYPNTRVTIEDPVSKLGVQNLAEEAHLVDRLADMRSMLEDKDCIIIGSPDVSDFAEQVLAKIHNIRPYAKDRIKSKGFVLIKDRKQSRSSFYWEKEEQEEESVAQIIDTNKYEYFLNKLPDHGRSGEMHGILIVGNNPFCRRKENRRIVILSGFSGVATNAIALLLTHESCLQEFFKFDNAYANIDRNIEALIGVRYVIEEDFVNRDTRRIEDHKTMITFERLVEI